MRLAEVIQLWLCSNIIGPDIELYRIPSCTHGVLQICIHSLQTKQIDCSLAKKWPKTEKWLQIN